MRYPTSQTRRYSLFNITYREIVETPEFLECLRQLSLIFITQVENTILFTGR